MAEYFDYNALFSKLSDEQWIKLSKLSDEQFSSLIQSALHDSLDTSSERSLRTFRELMPSVLAERRETRAAFEAQLYEAWGPALDLYDYIVEFTETVGDRYQHQFRKRAGTEQNWTFHVLVQLHARACLTAKEVGCLLRSGYANGAYTRWRTLHELSIAAAFIRDHGNDVAERYYFHEGIESARGAEAFNKHAQRLGETPIAQEMMARHSTRRDDLIARYGKAFKRQYGWAAHALKNESPTLSMLEENVSQDHMRPYYKIASESVHAGARGETPMKFMGNELLITGPTIYGLVEPAHAALLALARCTAVLITLYTDASSIVALRTIGQFNTEAGEALLQCHQAIEMRNRQEPSNEESRP